MTEFEQYIGAPLRAYKTSMGLIAAVEVGLFDFLGNGPARTREIAEACAVQEDALRILLPVLVHAGLIAREAPRWRLTPPSEQFLVKGRKSYAGDIARYHRHTAPAWLDLVGALRNPGRGRRGEIVERSPAFLQVFGRAMAEIAEPLGPYLEPLVQDVPARARLLDLGCGAAPLTRRLLARHPGWRATLVDALPVGKQIARWANFDGLEDRVEFLQSDILALGAQPQADVVLVSHVVHEHTESAARTLLQTAAGLVTPGGKVIVVEFDGGDDDEVEAAQDLFQLSVLVLCGQSVPRRRPADLRRIIVSAGLTVARRVAVDDGVTSPQVVFEAHINDPEDTIRREIL